jgi:hypothetical protein
MKTAILYCTLILLFISCKKEQPQPNNGLENCSCAHEVSADFIMGETSWVLNKFFESDTVYLDNNTYFKIYETNAEYRFWILNNLFGVQEHEQKFHLNSFDSFNPNGETFHVTSNVSKNPNQICFPNDNGLDTVSKFLTVIPKTVKPSYCGKFRVISDQQQDSIDITINYDFFQNSGYFVDILNYDGNGLNVEHEMVFELLYRHFEFYREDGVTPKVFGDLVVYNDQTVNFVFKQYNGNVINKVYNYKGRKL